MTETKPAYVVAIKDKVGRVIRYEIHRNGEIADDIAYKVRSYGLSVALRMAQRRVERLNALTGY
jgi:hypothetical protein